MTDERETVRSIVDDVITLLSIIDWTDIDNLVGNIDEAVEKLQKVQDNLY